MAEGSEEEWEAVGEKGEGLGETVGLEGEERGEGWVVDLH